MACRETYACVRGRWGVFLPPPKKKNNGGHSGHFLGGKSFLACHWSMRCVSAKKKGGRKKTAAQKCHFKKVNKAPFPSLSLLIGSVCLVEKFVNFLEKVGFFGSLSSKGSRGCVSATKTTKKQKVAIFGAGNHF